MYLKNIYLSIFYVLGIGLGICDFLVNKDFCFYYILVEEIE